MGIRLHHGRDVDPLSNFAREFGANTADVDISIVRVDHARRMAESKTFALIQQFRTGQRIAAQRSYYETSALFALPKATRFCFFKISGEEPTRTLHMRPVGLRSFRQIASNQPGKEDRRGLRFEPRFLLVGSHAAQPVQNTVSTTIQQFRIFASTPIRSAREIR